MSSSIGLVYLPSLDITLDSLVVLAVHHGYVYEVSRSDVYCISFNVILDIKTGGLQLSIQDLSSTDCDYNMFA